MTTFAQIIIGQQADSLADRIGREVFHYTDELGLHDGIHEALTLWGCEPQREARLDDRSRIDFLVGRIGVEVKVAGSAESVTRQLTRYAASPMLDSIVLVSTKSRHRSVPVEISGKPVRVVIVHGAAW